MDYKIGDYIDEFFNDGTYMTTYKVLDYDTYINHNPGILYFVINIIGKYKGEKSWISLEHKHLYFKLNLKQDRINKLKFLDE